MFSDRVLSGPDKNSRYNGDYNPPMTVSQGEKKVYSNRSVPVR
jgi:hypothetical protein